MKFCPDCATTLVIVEKFGELRPTCPNCGYIIFLDPKVVAVVLVEYQDKVLLGKRNINPGMGKWSFPGGYVNRGEKVEEAAIREVKEETNLDVSLNALLGVFSGQDNPIILIVYRAQVTGSIDHMIPQPEEVSELDFFSFEEMPELAFPFENKIMENWATRTHQISLLD